MDPAFDEFGTKVDFDYCILRFVGPESRWSTPTSPQQLSRFNFEISIWNLLVLTRNEHPFRFTNVDWSLVLKHEGKQLLLLDKPTSSCGCFKWQPCSGNTSFCVGSDAWKWVEDRRFVHWCWWEDRSFLTLTHSAFRELWNSSLKTCSRRFEPFTTLANCDVLTRNFNTVESTVSRDAEISYWHGLTISSRSFTPPNDNETNFISLMELTSNLKRRCSVSSSLKVWFSRGWILCWLANTRRHFQKAITEKRC